MAETTADELDKEQLAQLHNATLKASDSCFELKKLCATVLVPTAMLLVIFTKKNLDASVFVTTLMIIVAFWLADATGYYYQRTLRNAMAPIWERRAQRCSEGYSFAPRARSINAFRAAFNLSMSYYLILGSLVLVGFVLYAFGAISATPVVEKP